MKENLEKVMLTVFISRELKVMFHNTIRNDDF